MTNPHPRPLGDTDLARVLLTLLENSSHHGLSGEVDHLGKVHVFSLFAFILVRNEGLLVLYISRCGRDGESLKHFEFLFQF